MKKVRVTISFVVDGTWFQDEPNKEAQLRLYQQAFEDSEILEVNTPEEYTIHVEEEKDAK